MTPHDPPATSRPKEETLAGRRIFTHHDGHGLNERLHLFAVDEPDESGASHAYLVRLDGDALRAVMSIQFQRGPRKDPDSVPGCTEAVLLAVLIDRLRGFQRGPFACRENALQLTKIEEALHWTRARADARADAGVLGKLERH